MIVLQEIGKNDFNSERLSSCRVVLEAGGEADAQFLERIAKLLHTRDGVVQNCLSCGAANKRAKALEDKVDAQAARIKELSEELQQAKDAHSDTINTYCKPSLIPVAHVTIITPLKDVCNRRIEKIDLVPIWDKRDTEGIRKIIDVTIKEAAEKARSYSWNPDTTYTREEGFALLKKRIASYIEGHP